MMLLFYSGIIILIYNFYLKIYLAILYFKDNKSVIVIMITIKFFTFLIIIYVSNFFTEKFKIIFNLFNS